MSLVTGSNPPGAARIGAPPDLTPQYRSVSWSINLLAGAVTVAIAATALYVGGVR